MLQTSDFVRELRSQDSETDAVVDSSGVETAGGGAFLVGRTTTVATYPTVAKACYAIQIDSIAGNDTEGSTPTFASASHPTIFAWNVGKSIPPSGTEVVIALAPGGRWVFQYD